MGVLSIVNACSHLQNAVRARLGATSLPNTKYNLQLALAFQRAGLLESVTRSGREAPDAAVVAEHPAHKLSYRDVENRRLWVKLKYWSDMPVMKAITPLSTSKRRVTAQLPALKDISVGRNSPQVQGLSLGELLFLATDMGVLELREALQDRRGGLLLCRVQC